MPANDRLARCRSLRIATVFVLGTVLLALSGSGGSALAGEIQRDFTFDTDTLHLANLVGGIEVVSGNGSEFRVEVTIRGEDAEEGLIEFLTDDGDETSLLVHFPIDKERKYVYPPMGRNSKSTITFNDKSESGGSWLKKVFGDWHGKKITVAGKGKGLEVWADVRIEVPKGRSLAVRHGVGEIVASDVDGDLNLDINSGSISAERITGDLLADTGSGSVTVREQRGELHVDTGSGSVSVRDCDGGKVHVDTGSGAVDASAVVCNTLHIDTGSGSVTALRVETDKATIDTGSGSVELQLDRMGAGRFLIDTGSGSIELTLPTDASARITADTGSGSVRNKISGATVKKAERDEMHLIVGDGDARVTLDAGSGSITIREK